MAQRAAGALRLNHIKGITLRYAPLHPGQASVKGLWHMLNKEAVRKTNAECEVTTVVDGARGAAPAVAIDWEDGRKETIKAGQSHLHEILQVISDAQKQIEVNEMLKEPVEPVEDVALLQQAERMARLTGKLDS